MREQLTDELIEIFQAVAILSPTSLSFAGRLQPPPDPAAPLFAAPQTPPNPLLSQLQQLLYQYCYCQRFTGDLPSDPPVATPEDDLIPALSEANASRERWDAGWQIHQTLPSGQIVANKYGVTRLLWPGEFITHDGPGIAPRIGSQISAFLPRESRTMQPGFYFAFGENLADQQEDYNLIRFYWHVKSAGAADLIRSVTQELNRFQVPFRFKCPSFSMLYYRSDGAVLYVNKRFFRVTAELVADVHRKVREHLEPTPPLFTKSLAPGLALAEDPANGESFGMHRCRLLAEGIWNAYLEGLQTPQSRLAAVAAQFGQSGLSLERPYLNPASSDEYEWPGHQSQK